MSSAPQCVHPECSRLITMPKILCGEHWNFAPPRIRAGIQERIHGWKKRGDAVEFYKSYLSNLKRQERSAQ